MRKLCVLIGRSRSRYSYNAVGLLHKSDSRGRYVSVVLNEDAELKSRCGTDY
jgi:hypothetical protein